MDTRTKLLLDGEITTLEQHQTFKEMLLRLLDILKFSRRSALSCAIRV
jgi:hypothetical protein